jgi:hypothetical protein
MPVPHPEHPAGPGFEPRFPLLIATLVFVAAMLTLCWPMLAGRFIYGSDQMVAGYAFRHFGAEFFKAHGRIPEWNPYIFGGMPFIAAMHGDIFYPAAWLRWFLPEDLAMTLAYAGHLVIAGLGMFLLLRALKVSWTGAVVAGVSYEMSGILASLVSPGHDGKLFVSALAPFFFLGLLRAIRDGTLSGYGWVAVVTGLCMISPHYQLSYYMLVAGGVWTLYLVFWAEDRRVGLRWPVALSASLGAVVLGIAISAIQAMPFLSYLRYGARGANQGWEYATSYALPVEELMTTFLPQFNGVLSSYWGQNFFKLHSEYLGAIVILLAIIGLGDRSRLRLKWILLCIGGLFLLVAMGAHTPFYRLWYEVMPLMKGVRAPGMAFYLVAFVTCVFAGLGADRLLRGEVSKRGAILGTAVLGVIALLGAVGALQSVAVALAKEQMAGQVVGNASALQGGAGRLLFVLLAGGAVIWAVAAGKLRGGVAAVLLVVAVVADLWSVDRLFFDWSRPAREIFAEDALISRMKQSAPPSRVFDPGVYQGSVLMAYDIQQVLGYHGNEIRFYDDLMGGKNIWKNLLEGNPNVWNLLAVNQLVLPREQPLPGFHLVAGPAETSMGRSPGVLLERDTLLPYARVVGAAARVPDDQLVPTVLDPRFPVSDLVLFADTASVNPPALLSGQIPARPGIDAKVTQWEPGKMTIGLTGQSAAPSWLLVSENWYPDWHATVDGNAATVLRADNAFLSVELPPGAREVAFIFSSPSYRTGKVVTLVASLLALGLILVPAFRTRRQDA